MTEELIIHEYDYSNIVAVKEGIDYLVQYIDSCHKQYLGFVEEDKKRAESYAKVKKLIDRFHFHKYHLF